MATFRAERFAARCRLSPDASQEIEDFGFFDAAVPVVLVAREAAPGRQCQLFPLLPVPEAVAEDEEEEDDEDDDGEAPWAASVPGGGYEEAAADDEEDEEGEEEGDDSDVQVIAFPLGN